MKRLKQVLTWIAFVVDYAPVWLHTYPSDLWRWRADLSSGFDRKAGTFVQIKWLWFCLHLSDWRMADVIVKRINRP